MFFSTMTLANCPHVLGRAEVGAACRESFYCLSRNIRSAILLAVPMHMAMFFIFWRYTEVSGKERQRPRWSQAMDEEKVTERQKQNRGLD